MTENLAINHYLGWPLFCFIGALFGFVVVCFPGILSSKNQFGKYTFWSWPLLIVPQGLRRGAARLAGAALICVAMAGALIAHQQAKRVVIAAERTQTENFSPAKASGNAQQKSLYIHRLLVELRKTKPQWQFGAEEPMLVKIRPSSMGEKSYEINLLGRDYYQLGPEIAAARIISSIDKGTAPVSFAVSATDFPTAEQADAILKEANSAWLAKDYDRSLRLARQALEIRRSLMGNDHPRVREIESMLAQAKTQTSSVH